jgi:cell division protein FtsW
MTDQTLQQLPNRPRAVPANAPVEAARPEARVSWWTALDKPLVVIVLILLLIGSGMVYSTTFDWSYQERGSNMSFFLENHVVNVIVAFVGLAFFTLIDYRFWRRFAIWVLLATIGALVAVALFGDTTFGARRALIGGRFQPGELAAFAVILYMAAWLGSNKAKPGSFFYGLLPFGVIVGIIGGLLAIQPDLSTALIVALIALTMYFLAGAVWWHLATIMAIGMMGGIMFVQLFPYAQERLNDYVTSLSDPTRASYHTQQAIIAFVNGGWLGRGLGQSLQKIASLPAPHTDSIFAVIGEELGVVGASLVVVLYIIFVMRGFQIARRSVDPFGSLMAIGFTMWVAVQSLLNIAVMTAVVPASGLPLPFISYGGSSLLMLMCGVGLMLSISRVSTQRRLTDGRRFLNATYDRGGGNGRSRLSRADRRPRPGSTES